MGTVTALKDRKQLRQAEILDQLRYKPNLRQFLKNAVDNLSLNALTAIVRFAKNYSGDIDPNDIYKIGDLIAGKGTQSSLRMPSALCNANLRKFSQADRPIIQFLLLCIYYLYEEKTASQ